MNLCLNKNECVCSCHAVGAVGCTDCLEAAHITVVDVRLEGELNGKE